jgi:hypothetical protein
MYSAFEEIKSEILTGDYASLRQRIGETIANMQIYSVLFEDEKIEFEIRKMFFQIEDTEQQSGEKKNLELLEKLYNRYTAELSHSSIDGKSKEVMLAFLRQLNTQIQTLNLIG